MISAGVKADVNLQEIKKIVAASYNFYEWQQIV